MQVVEGGSRLLTGRDLAFADADADTRLENIRYSHVAVPNGEIVDARDPTAGPIFQFTQEDLNEKRVLFRHLGAGFGLVKLWISDGQYFVSTELKVRASPPFVRVANNRGLVVRRGDSGFISAANLSAETNLNVESEDIAFKITEAPRSGHLLRDDVPVSSFTLSDLEEERIEYRNSANEDGVDDTRDSFRLEITFPNYVNFF